MTDRDSGTRPIITVSNEVPYQYPRPDNIPNYSEVVLSQTESWAKTTIFGKARLDGYERNSDMQSRHLYLTWLTTMAREQKAGVESLLATLPNRPADPLLPGSWQTQRNTGGMQTCQLASAANALNFLYPQNPKQYTEEDILAVLGGQAFASANQHGVEAGEIGDVLRVLAPHIRTRRTNSVAEMIRATESGAAVMFPVSSVHEALIPPGHRIQRNADGKLYVLVADPMSTQPRLVDIDRLIKSNITATENPEFVENAVLIIEKTIHNVPAGLQTRHIEPARPIIRTVNPPAETIRHHPKIQTVEPRKRITEVEIVRVTRKIETVRHGPKQ